MELLKQLVEKLTDRQTQRAIPEVAITTENRVVQQHRSFMYELTLQSDFT